MPFWLLVRRRPQQPDKDCVAGSATQTASAARVELKAARESSDHGRGRMQRWTGCSQQGDDSQLSFLEPVWNTPVQRPSSQLCCLTFVKQQFAGKECQCWGGRSHSGLPERCWTGRRTSPTLTGQEASAVSSPVTTNRAIQQQYAAGEFIGWIRNADASPPPGTPW